MGEIYNKGDKARAKYYRKTIKRELDKAGSWADPLTRKTRRLYLAARKHRWSPQYEGLLRAIIFRMFTRSLRGFMQDTLKEHSFYDAIRPPQYGEEG